MLTKESLVELYVNKQLSVFAIATKLNCSQNKINYWVNKFQIPKRSISDAAYIKHNPTGDPFFVREPKTIEEAILYGMGLGLYWGEGTKKNLYSIRLGNSDPALIRKFIEFLEQLYSINRKKLRFGIQIFSDMDPQIVLRFWKNKLKVSSKQFYKILVTSSGKIGTYRAKTKYGVVTVYYNNKKLRDVLCGQIVKLQQI